MSAYSFILSVHGERSNAGAKSYFNMNKRTSDSNVIFLIFTKLLKEIKN